jgi:hypothetical protein
MRPERQRASRTIHDNAHILANNLTTLPGERVDDVRPVEIN